MNLLVDVGNSRIKWAVIHAGNFSHHAATPYSRDSVSDQLNRFWTGMDVPEQVWIANVAGQDIEEQITAWCVTYWHREPEFAQVQRSFAGVINAYSDITRLGVDRWLALIGARAHTNDAVLIADCGTAFTLDAMGQNGHHLGGLIMPGTSLMRNALYTTTPAIPVSTFRPPVAAALADNTDQAVANGCSLAVAATIERIMYDLKRGGVDNVQCILTGGDAGQIAMLINIEFEVRPHLVLEGLAVYASLAE